MPFNNRLNFHTIGDWSEDQVTTTAVADARKRIPQVEAIIDQTWQRTLSYPGTKSLFDGPICRLDHFNSAPGKLDLFLSITGYKTFVGTHLSGEHVFTQFGPTVMANPLGVSCSLETADGWLLLGRRNNTVAYYPDRIHPFAGSMDPRHNTAPHVFDEIRRELREEIGLRPTAITTICCTGLIEDVTLHHPELMFVVKTDQTRAQVEAGLNESEHHAVEAARADQASLENLLQNPQMTPVALGSVSLWGRREFGREWFDRVTR